ncbi:MAG: hypothetical protein K6F05_04400 [Succinivibrio sp.]|nr:hypothetical protein [Succinivibrio sp.]
MQDQLRSVSRLGARCALICLALCSFCSLAATEIRSAHLPPVPEGWNIKVNGQTVIYSSPKKGDSQRHASVLKFTHTKNTNGLDAQGYMEGYISQYNCSREKQLGKGFYTVSCRKKATDAVVVGEENNMYLLEITGEYSKTAVALLNTYLNEIVKGKHTFEDRDIGEKVYSKSSRKEEAPTDGLDAAAGEDTMMEEDPL